MKKTTSGMPMAMSIRRSPWLRPLPRGRRTFSGTKRAAQSSFLGLAGLLQEFCRNSFGRVQNIFLHGGSQRPQARERTGGLQGKRRSFDGGADQDRPDDLTMAIPWQTEQPPARWTIHPRPLSKYARID